MFINIETGRPAWLIEQDTDVVYCVEPPSVRTRHHIVTTPFAFFSTHREATADELAGKFGKPAPAVSMPMQQAAPKAPTVTPKGMADDPPPPARKPAAKKAAKKKPAAKAAKAEPAAEKPAKDNPLASPPPNRHGPHGEPGRD